MMSSTTEGPQIRRWTPSLPRRRLEGTAFSAAAPAAYRRPFQSRNASNSLYGDHDLLGSGSILRLLRCIPPETAHRLGLLGLRLPLRLAGPLVEDPFEWRGLKFRNRVGIAAGFDKHAEALPGVERMGVGFIEVGTILSEPWDGAAANPRVKRLPASLGIWNQLGFPSQGLARIRPRLEAFPRARRNGMVVAANIGPHPGRLAAASDSAECLQIAVRELTHLVVELHAAADLFVVNLSSPNTRGLRALLLHDELATGLLKPLKQTLTTLDESLGRTYPTPMLLKLPPEDPDRQAWSLESLGAIVRPFVDTGACDGFVAVNTSTRLAAEVGEDGGGVSGAPLLPLALETMKQLKRIAGDRCLLVGSGGITSPDDARRFLEAGADLVELYSGLIYRGPALARQCALALLDASRG
jgi:dihydroorotate dehydrogenase